MVIFERKWEIMDITEKEIYVKWHDYAYKDDLESAESLVEKHPRNAIVLGYYSMHNIAKKYLGDIFSIKIPKDDTHSLTLKALKEKINKEVTRKRVTELMKKAQEEYEIFSNGIAICFKSPLSSKITSSRSSLFRKRSLLSLIPAKSQKDSNSKISLFCILNR